MAMARLHGVAAHPSPVRTEAQAAGEPGSSHEEVHRTKICVIPQMGDAALNPPAYDFAISSTK